MILNYYYATIFPLTRFRLFLISPNLIPIRSTPGLTGSNEFGLNTPEHVALTLGHANTPGFLHINVYKQMLQRVFLFSPNCMMVRCYCLDLTIYMCGFSGQAWPERFGLALLNLLVLVRVQPFPCLAL
jgi:hypothetical protein